MKVRWDYTLPANRATSDGLTGWTYSSSLIFFLFVSTMPLTNFLVLLSPVFLVLYSFYKCCITPYFAQAYVMLIRISYVISILWKPCTRFRSRIEFEYFKNIISQVTVTWDTRIVRVIGWLHLSDYFFFIASLIVFVYIKFIVVKCRNNWLFHIMTV